MKKHVILFRVDKNTEKEYESALKYFEVYENRTIIPFNSIVIPRYSCLPWYKELENDLCFRNSRLVDNFKQFNYIADFEWYDSI